MLIVDPSLAWLVIVVGVVLAAAAIIGVVLIRRRRDSWQRFAKKYALRYDELPHGIRVYGSMAGKLFELATVRESSDAGALGVEEVVMSVRLSAHAAPDIEVVPGGPILGQAQKVLEENVVETGDEQFDSAAVVRSAQSDVARAYLNEGRRHAILKLFSGVDSCTAGLRGTELYIAEREIISRMEDLERHLQLLLEVARELEAG